MQAELERKKLSCNLLTLTDRNLLHSMGAETASINLIFIFMLIPILGSSLPLGSSSSNQTDNLPVLLCGTQSEPQVLGSVWLTLRLVFILDYVKA